MKHDHKEICKHDKLKYCKKCELVHCLSCDKEWPETVTEYINVPTPYNPTPINVPSVWLDTATPDLDRTVITCASTLN
jgi:hypothetical protein